VKKHQQSQVNGVQDRAFLAGSHVDITPDRPMQLAGFASRHEPFTSVADSLEANAVLLQCDGGQVVFLQIDVLSVGEQVRRGVLANLDGRIKEEELFLVASHTHFAPNIDTGLPEMAQIDTAYVADVVEQVSTMIDRLLSGKPDPVVLRYGESSAVCSVNRRAWCWTPIPRFPFVRRMIRIHPNASGPRDDTVRVLGIFGEGADATPKAVLWNYACHPVGFHDHHAISSDYPGAVRQSIREHFGEEIPVVFLPGFAGNLRPNKISRLPWRPKYFLHRLVNGPVFGRLNKRAWSQWVGLMASAVTSALASETAVLAPAKNRTGRYAIPLRKLMQGPVDDRCLTFHYVRLADRFIVVGLSAEPVVEYVADLKSAFKNDTVIPVGYTDAVCAYLPTSEMLADGGLETVSPGYSVDEACYRDTISREIQEAFRYLREIESL